MASEDPDAPSVPPAASAASAPPRPAAAPTAKRPRLGRWFAVIILLPVAAFVLLVVIGMFAPKPKPTDATSILRGLASDPMLATKAGIEGNLAETSAPGAPPGIQAEFLWTARPGALDADIATFDTIEHATAGFETFKEPGSLLVPADDGDTRYSGTLTDANSPAERRFYCAENAKGFACGSISAGLPVIVILRQPLETEVQKYDPSDPMSAFRQMDQSKARTDRMSRDMLEVDAVLQRLGITAQPTQN